MHKLEHSSHLHVPPIRQVYMSFVPPRTLHISHDLAARNKLPNLTLVRTTVRVHLMMDSLVDGDALLRFGGHILGLARLQSLAWRRTGRSTYS